MDGRFPRRRWSRSRFLLHIDGSIAVLIVVSLVESTELWQVNVERTTFDDGQKGLVGAKVTIRHRRHIDERFSRTIFREQWPSWSDGRLFAIVVFQLEEIHG